MIFPIDSENSKYFTLDSSQYSNTDTANSQALPTHIKIKSKKKNLELRLARLFERLVSEQGVGFGFLNVSLTYVRKHNGNNDFDYLHLHEVIRITEFESLKPRIKKIVRSLDENINFRIKALS